VQAYQQNLKLRVLSYNLLNVLKEDKVQTIIMHFLRLEQLLHVSFSDRYFKNCWPSFLVAFFLLTVQLP
jgi:hypothetical protein